MYNVVTIITLQIDYVHVHTNSNQFCWHFRAYD